MQITADHTALNGYWGCLDSAMLILRTHIPSLFPNNGSTEPLPNINPPTRTPPLLHILHLAATNRRHRQIWTQRKHNLPLRQPEMH